MSNTVTNPIHLKVLNIGDFKRVFSNLWRCISFRDHGHYPGSQAPFWGEEVTSPAIVGLNTFLVRLCHPIEGLGGLLMKFFWRDG